VEGGALNRDCRKNKIGDYKVGRWAEIPARRCALLGGYPLGRGGRPTPHGTEERQSTSNEDSKIFAWPPRVTAKRVSH